MGRRRAYRILCGVSGVALVSAGLAFFAAFFAFHAPASELPIPTGPVGFYFVAFTGCGLVAWGGCLFTALRHPEAGRTVGTATAFALVLSAVYRMVAWVVGDYAAWLGETPRVEAVLFLLAALAFVWLRPAPARGAT